MCVLGGGGCQGASGRIITETSNESLIGWSHSFWEKNKKVICSNLFGGGGVVGVWLHEFEGVLSGGFIATCQFKNRVINTREGN